MKESGPRVEDRTEVMADQQMEIIQIMLDKDRKAIELASKKGLLKEGAETNLFAKLEELAARANTVMTTFEQDHDFNTFSERIATIRKELEIKSITDTENFKSGEAGRWVRERFEELLRDAENYKKATDELDAKFSKVKFKRAA